MEAEIRYISLGPTDRIGPSAHYLRLGEWGILLDAGLDPAAEEESALPDFERIKNQPVNAIIISHAHLDHLGALPLAIRYFPHARVYMTPPTAVLSEKLLFHYIRVRSRQLQERRQKMTHLYSPEEVENILYLFQSFEYNFPFFIHGFQESQIQITFWDAGHILGSAGVEIAWQGKRFFYTGNTKKTSQFILKGAKYPASTDILLLEATYGADEEAPRIKKSAEVNRFVCFLKEVLNLGGSVLIPVFALGRTQEILVLLHRLIVKDRLPAVPIYLTGFGVVMNGVYDRLLHKVYPDYRLQRLRTITYQTLRGRRFRRPAIVLATSGMMHPNTLSYEIAADFLNERRNAIAFVGWADPETPGGSLREQKEERIRQIFGVSEVRCHIEVFRFSAHSHRLELLQLVKRLHPRTTILCHGETPALQWMWEKIRELGDQPDVIIPDPGEEIELV